MLFCTLLLLSQKFNKSSGCNKIRGKIPDLFYPGIIERRDEGEEAVHIPESGPCSSKANFLQKELKRKLFAHRDRI